MQQNFDNGRRALSGAGLLLALAALGCGAKPPCNQEDAKGCIIDKVRVINDRAGPAGTVSDDDVKDRLATAESSLPVTKSTVNLFGERGTLLFRYERFDRLVLERDVERVERIYKARGYYEARVIAARVIHTGESTVTVAIEVSVGPPTLVEKVEIALREAHSPLPADPPDLAQAVNAAKASIAIGKPFDEDTYAAAKQQVVRAMTDRGYAYAEATGKVDIDLARHRAGVVFSVRSGPPCTFGEVSLDGHGDLPESKLRAAIGIRPGSRFSTDALDAAQAALGDIGVFSSVSVEVGRSKEGEAPVVPVRFVVQRSALRAIQIGGGAELGGRVQTHLVTSWEHKNFLGGLRRFSIGARGGVLFYPLQLTSWDRPVRPLPDVRTQAELKQPGFLEARTTGSFRVEANFYRPETAIANVDATTQNLFANLEARGVAGLERPFWLSRVRLGASVNLQVIAPVAVYGDKPEGFKELAIPYLELRAALDLRKGKEGKPDALNPRSGIFVGTTVQGALIEPDHGGDLRIQPEVRGYIPLGLDVTLGLRLAGGLLLPFGYGERLFDPAMACGTSDTACQAERARAVQILQLRGFYSGGTSSNRGYGYNGVNPRETVPNLFEDPKNSKPVPIGGRWLWDASIELRFPIYKSFGGAVFADASDVWNEEAAFRPHLSPGFGLRYATPIGPARLDAGFRVPCLQVVGTCDELPEDQGGPPRLLGLPVYIAIAIGEAF